MSTSSLLPSPLLSPLSALSPTQQKVLRNYGTYLNLEKYVDGKKLYLAFIEAKSQKDESKYINFIKQFQSHNYVNKMLHISSMKYYRDIKTLLIGGVPDAGIRQHLRYKYIDINQVIIQLDAAAYVEDVPIQKRKSKLITNGQRKLVTNGQRKLINGQRKLQQQNQQNNAQKPQSNQTNNSNQSSKRHARKFLSSSTINDQESAKIIRKQQQFKNSKMVLIKPQKHYAQQQFQLTYLPDAKEESQKSHKQSQLHIIKLIKVQNKQDRTRSVKSQRNYISKSTLPAKSGSIGKNKETNSVYQKHIKNSHITENLQQNKLYHQRHEWKSHHSSQLQYLQVPKLKKSQSKDKKQAKNQRTQTGNICDKILSFLRSLGILKNQNSQTVKKEKSKNLQQSKPLINKSKSSVNKTQYSTTAAYKKVHYS